MWGRESLWIVKNKCVSVHVYVYVCKGVHGKYENVMVKCQL
jgi:hypothetical protein